VGIRSRFADRRLSVFVIEGAYWDESRSWHLDLIGGRGHPWSKCWERYGLKSWIEAAKNRLRHNVLAIALANKLARIAWTVLNKGRAFVKVGSVRPSTRCLLYPEQRTSTNTAAMSKKCHKETNASQLGGLSGNAGL
jgi:hypothetical protein